MLLNLKCHWDDFTCWQTRMGQTAESPWPLRGRHKQIGVGWHGGIFWKRLDFSTNNNWVYKNGNADIFTIIIPLSDPSLRMVTYFPLLFIEVTMWPGSSVNITFGGEASPVSLSQAGKNYLSSQLLCSLTCPPNKGYLIVLPRLSYK